MSLTPFGCTTRFLYLRLVGVSKLRERETQTFKSGDITYANRRLPRCPFQVGAEKLEMVRAFSGVPLVCFGIQHGKCLQKAEGFFFVVVKYVCKRKPTARK